MTQQNKPVQTGTRKVTQTFTGTPQPSGTGVSRDGFLADLKKVSKPVASRG